MLLIALIRQFQKQIFPFRIISTLSTWHSAFILSSLICFIRPSLRLIQLCQHRLLNMDIQLPVGAAQERELSSHGITTRSGPSKKGMVNPSTTEIIRLYRDERLKLKDVMEIMEREGVVAKSVITFLPSLCGSWRIFKAWRNPSTLHQGGETELSYLSKN